MAIERELDNEKIDSAIRALGNLYSDLESIEHEELYQKPEIHEEDEVKQIIKEMLYENTGCDVCDSGRALGRHWERNRSKNFDDDDAIDIEVWNNEVMIRYNIYHYLTNFLEITNETKRLQKVLDEYVNREESSSYLQDMEDFIEYLIEEYDFNSLGIVNTCNYDNIISQVLQYGIVGNGDVYNIILQIHNGCDIRGGYTKPRIFSLGYDEFDYFSIAQKDVNAFCKKCGMCWHSDDGGCNFYGDGCAVSDLNIELKQDMDFKIKTYELNNKVFHKNCSGEINFNVMESY